MNSKNLSFNDVETKVLQEGYIVTKNRKGNRFRKQKSRLLHLSVNTFQKNNEAIFRQISDKSKYREIIRLCCSSFGGFSHLLEGKTILFQQWYRDRYYHLLMPTCDPRTGKSKMMAKSEFDVHREIAANFKLERHERVYGRKNPKGRGMCAVVDKEKYEEMAKLYFFEKIYPLVGVEI